MGLGTDSYDDFHKKIDEFLDRAEEQNIVSSIRGLFKYLRSQKAMKRHCLMWYQVIIHYLNRDEYGANPSDVHLLLSDIFDTGFDDEEVRAVCCTIDPRERDRAVAFHKQQVASSQGLLPPCNLEQSFYLALWGTHTNLALGCLDSEVEHDNPAMTVDGRLNAEKVKLKDPLLAEAATSRGLSWDVIPYEVMRPHMPRIATLISNAGNAPAQVSRPIDNIQVAKKIYNAWYEQVQKAMKERGISTLTDDIVPNFTAIKQKVLKSKPPNPEIIPFLYKFLMKYSGGLDAKYLRRTERICKLTSSDRFVSADVYD